MRHKGVGFIFPAQFFLADEYWMVPSRNAQRGVLDNHKPEEAIMKNIIHNTVAVEAGIRGSGEFCLYWQDEDGNNSEFICVVHGFDNAVRVANGIAHEQVEFVKHPCFDPDEVAA